MNPDVMRKGVLEFLVERSRNPGESTLLFSNRSHLSDKQLANLPVDEFARAYQPGKGLPHVYATLNFFVGPLLTDLLQGELVLPPNCTGTMRLALVTRDKLSAMNLETLAKNGQQELMLSAKVSIDPKIQKVTVEEYAGCVAGAYCQVVELATKTRIFHLYFA
jgi:hypothetical protein